jgi:hypothetical protein
MVHIRRSNSRVNQMQQLSGAHDPSAFKLILRETLLVAHDREICQCRHGAGDELVILGVGTHS